MRASVILTVLAFCLSLVPALNQIPAHAEQTFRDCSECPEMVGIPAGEFVMGSNRQRESPVHSVRNIPSFAIGSREITRDQFAAFVTATHRPSGEGCLSRDATGARAFVKGATWLSPGIMQTGHHPAVCVTFADAVAYVGWLSKFTGYTYRLPSEAEWEYSARAGSTTPWFWGRDRSQACQYANVPNVQTSKLGASPDSIFSCEDGYADTAPVGTYRQNGFGLYEVLGNVWEWVEDCWHDSYMGASGGGKAWIAGADYSIRTVRGGGSVASRTTLSVSARTADLIGYRGIGLGFRVARDAE